MAIRDSMLPEASHHPARRIGITRRRTKTVGTENFYNVGHHFVRIERRPPFARQIKYNALALAVRYCHRHRVVLAPRRVNMSNVFEAQLERPLQNSPLNTSFDNSTVHIGAEIPTKFCLPLTTAGLRVVTH